MQDDELIITELATVLSRELDNTVGSDIPRRPELVRRLVLAAIEHLIGDARMAWRVLDTDGRFHVTMRDEHGERAVKAGGVIEDAHWSTHKRTVVGIEIHDAHIHDDAIRNVQIELREWLSDARVYVWAQEMLVRMSSTDP